MNQLYYYSFTEKGKEDLPTDTRIFDFKNEDVKPIIFLDSCVCLDIVKTIDYKNKAQNANREKVLNLKKYLSVSHIKINPMFGLMELCYENGKFNERKFWDFKNRIKYFEEIPLKHFQKLNFDFNKEFILLFTPEVELSATFNALDYFFLNAYCSLLKIRELSINGLSRRRAKSNILEFFNWMSDDLGIILGIEYILAMKIFGGSTEFRKMIWLDGKQNLIKKKLIGTAWDIFHARLSTNNFEFNKLLDNRKIYSYFLTNDFELFNLFAQYGLFSIVEKSNDSGSLRLFNADLSVPHLDNDFIDEQNERMVKAMSTRFNKKLKNDPLTTKSLIRNLEIKNNIA